MGLNRKDPAMQVHIRARMGKPEDADAILSLLATADTALGGHALRNPGVFAGLIKAGKIMAGCIELHQPGGGWALGAAGVSAFIGEAEAAAWAEAPSPHFAAQLLDLEAAGSSVFLAPPAIARANAGGGLNLFVLGFACAFAPGSPLVPPLLTRAIEHFVSCHRGYFLKRLMREDPAPVAEMFVRSGMRSIGSFATADGSRVATLMERSDTSPLFPHSPAAMLFQFLPPLIGFSASERRVLELALDGLSDGEIAAELSLSPHTLKRLWRLVFSRCAEALPDLFEDCGTISGVTGVRGPEKRGHVLRYVRHHPEELRAYCMAVRA